MSDSNPGFGDVDPEVFRAEAHRAVDWIADYLANPERYPVLARVRPGEIRQQLPDSPPEVAEPLDALVSDFEQIILPGITHWNHPGFLGILRNYRIAPGILGEMLAAALNVNAMLWRTSPAATELEQTTTDWLRQTPWLARWLPRHHQRHRVVELPLRAGGRSRGNWSGIRRKGLGGRTDLPRLRVYASEEAHSSIDKAAIVLGIGQDGRAEDSADPDFPHGRIGARGRRSPRTARRARCPSPSSRPSGPPRRPASIRCPRSPSSARARGSGCTSTRPTAARRRSFRS